MKSYMVEYYEIMYCIVYIIIIRLVYYKIR